MLLAETTRTWCCNHVGNLEDLVTVGIREGLAAYGGLNVEAEDSQRSHSLVIICGRIGSNLIPAVCSA